MTTVYLVRHGETDWNTERRMQGQTDIPLNEKGTQQAEACGAALHPGDYDVVISSHLQRAHKTAEIINRYLRLPAEVMEDFAERSFGDAEGMTLEERRTLFPDHDYPNQEPIDIFSERIMSGLDKVHQKHLNQNVLLVAHGAVIYRILSIISNGKIDLGNRKIENTSISTIDWVDGDWVIRNFNQIDHLIKIESPI